MDDEKLLHVEDLNIEFHDHLVPETVVYDFDLDLEEGVWRCRDNCICFIDVAYYEKRGYRWR